MLETERLILDQPDMKYLHPIFEVHSDPEINLYNPAGPVQSIEDFEKTMQEWQEHHKQHGFGYYILVRKDNQKPFGVCGLRFTELEGEQLLNLYYRISADETRQGFVKEACRKVIDAVLEKTENKYRIMALTRNYNIPSIKTAESLGFKMDESCNDLNGKDNVYLFNR